MFEDDDDGDVLLISLNIETRITRVIGNTLMPAKLTLRTDVNPIEDIPESEISAILSKIRFWFENLVSKSIAFSFDNDDALGMFIDPAGKNRTSNLIMLTPSEPSDDLLATLFQAKMSALAAGKILFSLVEIKSDNQVGLSFIFVGSGEKALPTMEQWIGERSYFDRPWWARDDASTLDIVPPDEADLDRKPPWAFSLDVLNPKVDTGIVVRPQFKPTIISGGKPEK